MSRLKLQAELIGIFQDSLGIAAEFVIEDALAELDLHLEWTAHPKLRDAQLLITLGRHLPPEAQLARLRPAVVDAINRHSTNKD
jgi:hypothetical protein